MSDFLVMNRRQYRDFLLASVSRLGVWEVWRELYNAGWRGRDLNGWLR